MRLKKSYTNYRIAQVTLSGESVRVRSAANTDADVIEELSDGTYVYVLSGENDFIKICYGDDYKEGYVINTSLQFTGEWIEKDTIAQKQQEIADAKAAAEKRAERIAKQKRSRSQRCNICTVSIFTIRRNTVGSVIFIKGTIYRKHSNAVSWCSVCLGRYFPIRFRLQRSCAVCMFKERYQRKPCSGRPKEITELM